MPLLLNKQRRESLDNCRIELRACTALQFYQGLLRGAARLIGILPLHGVIGFRHGDDACGLWDVLSCQLIRIAVAIPVFMMMAYRRHQVRKEGISLQDLCAQRCMFPEPRTLMGGKRVGLLQDLVRDRYLSNVVQSGCHANLGYLFGLPSHGSGDSRRQVAHAMGMGTQALVAPFQQSEQRVNQAQRRGFSETLRREPVRT